MGADEDVRDGGLNFRHVASDALATRRIGLVMGVFFECSRVWTIKRHGAVTVETEFVDGLSKLGVVLCAVYVVAIEAGDSAPVHHALHEIIALHSVFMCSAIGEVRECSLAQYVFFKHPKVRQLQSHAIAYGPIVVFPFNWIRQWASLRVALNTDVIRSNVVHFCWIQNVVAGSV